MFINFKWFLLILALSWITGRMGLRSLKWTAAIVGLALTRSLPGALMGLLVGYLLEGILRGPKVHVHYERHTYQTPPHAEPSARPSYIPEPVLAAYRTLGISPDASDDEVRQAYRRMAMMYHPDHVATQSEDTRSRAERLFKMVGEAKDRIFKYRGMK